MTAKVAPDCFLKVGFRRAAERVAEERQELLKRERNTVLIDSFAFQERKSNL